MSIIYNMGTSSIVGSREETKLFVVAMREPKLLMRGGNDQLPFLNRKRINLVALGVLPVHPEDVTVAAWEIVLEPDVEDGDPTGNLVYKVRVSGDIQTKAVTVPADYLVSLPDDTPVKIEVGAIGVGDNATFTEVGDICVNENEGCE